MIPLPVMQVCGSASGKERLLDFEFVKAITCEFADEMGIVAFGGLVFFFIAGSVFIRTGSPIIPYVMLLLVGGAVMFVVPALWVQVATIFILLLGAGVTALLYLRFSR